MCGTILILSKGKLVACDTAEHLERRLAGIDRDITVAVMGCVVNGPGEAREADYGIAGGKGNGILFKKGEIIRRVPEDKLCDALLEMIQKDVT